MKYAYIIEAIYRVSTTFSTAYIIPRYKVYDIGSNLNFWLKIIVNKYFLVQTV